MTNHHPSRRRCILLCLLTLFLSPATAQEIEKAVEERLNAYFNAYETDCRIGTPALDSVRIDFDRRQLAIYASDNFSYQPFRPDNVQSIYRAVQARLPGPVYYFKTTLYTAGKAIEELIPNVYRERKERDKRRLPTHADYDGAPWVTNASRPYRIPQGLENRHLSLWHSHGKYYHNQRGEWLWQRPRLFCTTEDMFTQSVLLPYVVPMLENAGAIVYTPRERDIQKHEVVVDNDTPNGSTYLEANSKKASWGTTNRPGFAHRKATYRDGENPFTAGTCRLIAAEKPRRRRATAAFAEWVPRLPEKGRYAVYVSYQTLPNSVDDAQYIVFHNGGATEFKVNQRMGGGTWVYLGTFEFDQGSNDHCMVVLTNRSNRRGVVCADAVRFGGGMGNIERGGSVSGMPRFLEGARYAAQWAGMPYEVYAPFGGEDDYSDDLNARSHALNYLSGGSVFNPHQTGLGVPLELNVALHTDAGRNASGAFIGSLGIYTTAFNQGMLNDGTDRYASRDLADLLLTQIRSDVEQSFRRPWTRRSLWNRNYSETRLPAVPSAIVELLSHQNFADMQLGHDPNFKFAAARAIYKGILRFVAGQHGEACTVQPLPVSHFALRFGKKKNTVELSWQGEDDPQEPSATPREYIVYTRVGQGGFDNGTRVDKPAYTAKLQPGVVYSFKVTAVNRGGESFPSEILSACRAKHEEGRVLIVNGFDRLSGPACIDTPREAGFAPMQDPGVPYLYTTAFCGAQANFSREPDAKQGNDPGRSGSEWEGRTVAGNTFDYPFVHGKAIQAAGRYSFVSCSDETVEDGQAVLEQYDAVDLILGLEKESPADLKYYKTFSSPMQRVLAAYCQSGGRLMVSGAYVGSDMAATQGNRDFTANVLKYAAGGSLTDRTSGRIRGLGRTPTIPRIANEQRYAVPSPDCLAPVGTAFAAMVYEPSRQCAAVAYRGTDYRTFVMGFPFESIEVEADRAALMASILHFLTEEPQP